VRHEVLSKMSSSSLFSSPLPATSSLATSLASSASMPLDRFLALSLHGLTICAFLGSEFVDLPCPTFQVIEFVEMSCRIGHPTLWLYIFLRPSIHRFNIVAESSGRFGQDTWPTRCKISILVFEPIDTKLKIRIKAVRTPK
jgi:hypothetical protein